MSLNQCLREHTDRQIEVWNAWLDMQWNEPSRTDYYLMQIAGMLSSKTGVTVGDFRIPFHTKTGGGLSKDDLGSAGKSISAEEASRLTRERWCRMFGASNFDELKRQSTEILQWQVK